VIESHHADQSVPKNVVVYDINGPLFFGSAQKALRNIVLVRPNTRVVVLDMSEVTLLDMSAIVAMESIVDDLRRKQIGLVINNLHPRMILKLRRAGVRKQSGQLAFARTLHESFDIARNRLQQPADQ
jgi:SulP family sulfate permease